MPTFHTRVPRGAAAVCTQCGRAFSSASVFDAHQRIDGEDTICLPPDEAGLREHDLYAEVWTQDSNYQGG